MRNLTCLRIAWCGLCLFIIKSVCAQSSSLDTASKPAVLKHVDSLYTAAVGENLPLYNGPEYYLYNPAEIRGSAYFNETLFTIGNVYYDGAAYTNVQLLYDLYNDKLVSMLSNQAFRFALVNDRVRYFDLAGHHFINISADTLPQGSALKTGFYDEIYQGNTQVLSKKFKNVQSYTSTTGEREAYKFFSDLKADFFIRKNNIYYSVSSQGALLDILKDKKKMLQQYIKASKIKYKKDPAQALASIAAYYDQLSNQHE